MTSLAKRHEQFAELHRAGCFVLPNPWDMGSAKMMVAAGARALATTSSGYSFTLGRPDMGRLSREEALAHAENIISATPLPVSGDFENGFADEPDEVAETIRLAGEIGLSGCSIEDTMMVDGNPAYAFEDAVRRIEAAVDAARSLGRPFILCARADGVMNGSYDLDEGIRRLQAFEKVGADCVYIPVPPGLDELRGVLSAVSVPVNALATGPLTNSSVDELAKLGVRRISLGGMVARLTHAAIRNAMAEVFSAGTFQALKSAAKGSEIDAILSSVDGTKG
jgi:2-methylisocitrate lyase-like PEP mutase family enzyme